MIIMPSSIRLIPRQTERKSGRTDSVWSSVPAFRFMPVARVAALLLTLALISGACFAQKKEKLDKNYREWLERDVPYIITKDERDEFLQLTTNDARDKFIDQFWEIRNPNPGTGTNSYKEEIYRRIAFANARFGIGSGEEGWRTARGRTYITLGEPQQKQIIRNAANLFPMEIWFYANVNPTLPQAFYVLFYQRDGRGDYRFYSPYMDGPDKLATGVEAINSPAAGLAMIERSVGPEVARVSLSLLPDEPVDLNNPRPTLQSDILLNEIKSLANQPANREDIARRRSLSERVTSRLLFERKDLDIVSFPARDGRGLTRVDYAIRLHDPSDLTLTEENGRYQYSVEVRVIVFAPDNKPIFTQQKTVTDSFDKSGMERIRDKVFGYEGILPLPPGKYHLDIQLTDWSKKAAFHSTRDITVPPINVQGLTLPAILPFVSAENVDAGLSDLTPFAFAGVKFNPMLSMSPTLIPGQDLQVMYQVWSPPKDPRAYLGQKLRIEYALGKPADMGGVTRITDELPMEQFDAAGDIVTGKKFALEQQTPGNYLLSLTVNKAGGTEHAAATATFKVLKENSAPQSWDVVEPDLARDAETGTLDLQRGLCYLALGQAAQARAFFRRALQLNRSDDVARSRLVDAYFSLGDHAAVVSLYKDSGVTDHTDSETIMRIASSLAKSGNSKDAIALLEGALRSRPEDGPLYLALARYYNQIGDARKAAELAEKGKSYLNSSHE